MLKWALMPLDSASECFLKLLPTPDSFTVVRFGEPNILRKKERDRHWGLIQKFYFLIVLKKCKQIKHRIRVAWTKPVLLHVLFTEKAEVSIIYVKDKVVRVTIERDDFPLGIRGHSLEQNALVVLHALQAIFFLSLTIELDLRRVTENIWELLKCTSTVVW